MDSIGVAFLLLGILAVAMLFWLLRKKRKTMMRLLIVIGTLIVTGIGITCFSLYRRHAFSFTQTVTAGENTLPFEVPFVAPLKGHYSIYVRPIKNPKARFTVQGYVYAPQDKSTRSEFAGNCEKESEYPLPSVGFGVGVTIDKPIRRKGVLFINIRGETQNEEYRVFVGRIFP